MPSLSVLIGDDGRQRIREFSFRISHDFSFLPSPIHCRLFFFLRLLFPSLLLLLLLSFELYCATLDFIFSDLIRRTRQNVMLTLAEQSNDSIFICCANQFIIYFSIAEFFPFPRLGVGEVVGEANLAAFITRHKKILRSRVIKFL